jgi:hypothetical protein
MRSASKAQRYALDLRDLRVHRKGGLDEQDLVVRRIEQRFEREVDGLLRAGRDAHVARVRETGIRVARRNQFAQVFETDVRRIFAAVFARPFGGAFEVGHLRRQGRLTETEIDRGRFAARVQGADGRAADRTDRRIHTATP